MRYCKEEAEVEQFLERTKELISVSGKVVVNNQPWAGKVNKTLRYMAETGITQSDIENVILDLQVCHYSYTADDKNGRFANEQVWIFGITRNLVDKDEDYYVKLKIRKVREEFLLVLSFHPEEPVNESEKLSFPYC